MKIVFATNNQHKLEEIRAILGSSFEVVSLSDIGCHEDIPETGDTLDENAWQKANYVYEHYGLSCFADDTGLEVEALDGGPGVHTARFAAMDGDGDDHDADANTRKLLRVLKDKDNRRARFRTVIALILKGQGARGKEQESTDKEQDMVRASFEGIVNGEITTEKRGEQGFGYDPVFRPEGYEGTFAELGVDVKNDISHRARATKKLAQYLSTLTVLLFCLFTFLPLPAQVGTWKNYLAYHDITEIEKGGNMLYVLASNGLYTYNQNDQSIQTYDKVNGLSDCGISHIAWNNSAKQLLIIYNNYNIDLLDSKGTITNISDYYSKSMTVDKTVYSIYINNIYAYLSTGFGIVKVNVRDAEISDTYNLGFRVDYSYIEGDHIYAASSTNGLYSALLTDNLLDKNKWSRVGNYTARTNTIDAELLAIAETLNPGGPKYNYFGFMKFTQGGLYTCNGHGWTPREPGSIQVLKDDEWNIIGGDEIKETTGLDFINMMCLDVDHNNSSHLMVGARTGVYEFHDNKLTHFYNEENSPIESAVSDNTKMFDLVTGALFTANSDLLILNSQAPTQALLKLNKDNTWEQLKHKELMVLSGKSAGFIKGMITDSRGLVWFVNNHWIDPAVFSYNPTTDTVTKYDSFTNQDGTTYSVYRAKCIAEDKEGNIWFGTDNGLFYLTSDDIANENTEYINQYKVPRNDGTNYADYLLSATDITAIAIDAANRKWIGTSNNGAYLISADNNTQEQHFNTSNSDLLSNSIESIAINHDSGEVFFGTDKGLCSYMGDATTAYESMSKDNVYAYPNPVKPDYDGPITVTGLSFDADVKIVTSNGVLVAEGRSNGGTFTWDGTDLKGKRVASGIYFVETATQSGGSGTVCKIAIIN